MAVGTGVVGKGSTKNLVSCLGDVGRGGTGIVFSGKIDAASGQAIITTFGLR